MKLSRPFLLLALGACTASLPLHAQEEKKSSGDKPAQREVGGPFRGNFGQNMTADQREMMIKRLKSSIVENKSRGLPTLNQEKMLERLVDLQAQAKKEASSDKTIQPVKKQDKAIEKVPSKETSEKKEPVKKEPIKKDPIKPDVNAEVQKKHAVKINDDALPPEFGAKLLKLEFANRRIRQLRTAAENLKAAESHDLAMQTMEKADHLEKEVVAAKQEMAIELDRYRREEAHAKETHNRIEKEVASQQERQKLWEEQSRHEAEKRNREVEQFKARERELLQQMERMEAERNRERQELMARMEEMRAMQMKREAEMKELRARAEREMQEVRERNEREAAERRERAKMEEAEARERRELEERKNKETREANRPAESEKLVEEMRKEVEALRAELKALREKAARNRKD
jgi:hypothetical protein